MPGWSGVTSRGAVSNQPRRSRRGMMLSSGVSFFARRRQIKYNPNFLSRPIRTFLLPHEFPRDLRLYQRVSRREASEPDNPRPVAQTHVIFPGPRVNLGGASFRETRAKGESGIDFR